jgi:hypothetical protein
LKNAIPSFAFSEDNQISKVTCTTTETPVVQDALVDLQDSKEQGSDGNEEVEVIDGNDDKTS